VEHPRARATIRTAQPSDAAAVQRIYAPVVEGSVISFEYEPPSAEEMARRIESTLRRLPWLVAEIDGRVVGYAYAAPHGERSAYRWSVDTSIYLDAESRGVGIGRQLYDHLLSTLAELGYVNAYAGITLPNEASVGLHEACGYEPVGVYRSVGYKFGQWHDVGWWHRRLHDSPRDPAVPRAFA
jgi:phosphinothricin acetyltransferase